MTAKAEIEYEATWLHSGYYAVRPKGQLGTCGWVPVPWAVTYVTAKSPKQALQLAAKQREELNYD